MNVALSAPGQWVIQVVLGPLAINERLMQPRQSAQQPLGFALPPPSYLSYGSLALAREDINNQNAMIAIEHDAGFCRVDGLNTVDEVMSRV